MPEISISVQELLNSLNPQEQAALAEGTLDNEQVYFEYLTQEDDKVRPSHRALHGTVWHVGDPNAPIPPIDYGCRCFIRYVAKPGTPAAKLLPEAEKEPTTQTQAWTTFLNGKVTNWKAMVADVKSLPIGEQLAALALKIQDKLQSTLTDARDLARMALAVEI